MKFILKHKNKVKNNHLGRLLNALQQEIAWNLNNNDTHFNIINENDAENMPVDVRNSCLIQLKLTQIYNDNQLEDL